MTVHFLLPMLLVHIKSNNILLRWCREDICVTFASSLFTGNVASSRVPLKRNGQTNKFLWDRDRKKSRHSSRVKMRVVYLASGGFDLPFLFRAFHSQQFCACVCFFSLRGPIFRLESNLLQFCPLTGDLVDRDIIAVFFDL